MKRYEPQKGSDSPLAEEIVFSCRHEEDTDLVAALRYYIENHWKCRDCRNGVDPAVIERKQALRKAAKLKKLQEEQRRKIA